MLEASGLKKGYAGVCVVRCLTLQVSPGEIVGLLGPNGAGKTTTFRMMVGLVHPDSGTIIFDGQVITQMPLFLRARSGIGYLPQETSVFRGLTVSENIMAILETLPLTRAERHDRLSTLMEEFKITHLASRQSNTLSGGERRRLEIARALVLSPRYLLLDEPFAGMDPMIVADIQDVLFQLKQKGIGVLVTDHRVQEMLDITDRAYVMHQGEILVSGTPPEIANSQEAKTRYLGDGFRWRTN